MKDIIPAKKQSPILGLTGMGGGVGSNLGGSLAKSPYIEDVFSTYLYEGTNGSKVASTGVDMTKGGMVWWKNRSSNSTQHVLIDTERGANKVINADSSGTEFTGNYSQTFTSTGWTMNNGFGDMNNGNNDYTSWNFRKQEGFFDVVTYTGSSSARTIAHNLGCKPGSIFIKKTSGTDDWAIYHRGANSADPATQYYKLNTNSAFFNSSDFWNDTEPTDSVFSLGNAGAVNSDGHTYVAYLFAGGNPQGNASTYFADRGAIWYGQSGITSYDFTLSTYNFTHECWFKAEASDNIYRRLTNFNDAWTTNTHTLIWDHQQQPNRMSYFVANYDAGGSTPLLKSGVKSFDGDGQWHHVAITRSGNTFKMYLDGTEEDSATWSGSLDSGNASYMIVGGTTAGTTAEYWKGNISNVRLVRGASPSSSTAVLYTSNFTPSTSPLTTTSQGAVASEVRFLGCNDVGVAGYTKTSIPARTYSNTDSVNLPQGSPDSPFESSTALDLSAIFGEDKDQPMIKCGSYHGNNGWNVISLGFQPQWILIKNMTNGSTDWQVYDSMRGIVDQSGNTGTTTASEKILMPNNQDDEYTQNYLQLSMDGFTLRSNDDRTNANNAHYAYIAIRRSDGIVGKPAKAGTDAFNVMMSPDTSTEPLWTSNFPVDWAWQKSTAGTSNWYTGARQTGDEYLSTNLDSSKGNMGVSLQKFDYNNGWWDATGGTSQNSYISHMWKRGQGFDVVPFQATGDNPYTLGYKHFLGQAPELKIIKRRQDHTGWIVGGSAIAGDANIRDWFIGTLDTNSARTNSSNYWDGLDTATHFTVRSGNGAAGGASADFLALLYASVTGISKVGQYTGTGATGNNITAPGFQPRFLLIKRLDSTSNWNVWDSVRGWDKVMYLNDTDANQNLSWVSVSASGFSLITDNANVNASGGKYLYYAHA